LLKFDVEIKGMSPLLFNRFPDEDNPDDKSNRKTANLNKEEQVEKSLYRDDKGDVYSPADHIIGAMIKAGSAFKLTGKQTFGNVMKAGIFVEPLKVKHVHQDYTADWRPVVIKATKGRVMKGRARMDDWCLKFQVVCIDERARAQDVEEILKYAGNYIGIGDYRPRYGRFEVTNFKAVK